jgi:Universal stress protein family
MDKVALVLQIDQEGAAILGHPHDCFGDLTARGHLPAHLNTSAEPLSGGVKSRDAARSIVVYGEDNDIDHIVVGTGGKRGVARLMLGSVSSDVIARAHCPVTVAR